MNGISTSLFDIFKPGPGPSSSHTIGPMRAAAAFLRSAEQLPADTIDRIHAIKVHLYGSLSSTGKGHGTDRAAVAGLLGQTPDNCCPKTIRQLLQDNGQVYSIAIGKRTIPLTAADIIFETEATARRFANTMRIDLLDIRKKALLNKIYYSIGGGFILCEGEAEPVRPLPPHTYANFRQFKNLVKRTGLSPVAIIMQNEQAISGITAEEVNAKLDQLMDIMDQAVTRGLSASGILPGKIGLERKAGDMFARAQNISDPLDRYLLLINAFAMAAAEENADGQIVVTAPTSGASGVIPGILYFLKHHRNISQPRLREGLLIAGLIAFVAKHNASISGAEVGCQGEIGVASAMAAALLAYVKGCSLEVIENAAESALEHHLGMTCDPIGGYVQIPCIERNAVGAITAYNASLLASGGNPDKHKLRLDAVIEVMLETGRDMSDMYKETACGGLAVCGLCG